MPFWRCFRSRSTSRVVSAGQTRGTTANAIASVKYIRSLPNVNGKIGAVGFCWGGGVINQLAINDPTLDAGSVYYGTPPTPDDQKKPVHALILLNYAEAREELGQLTNADWAMTVGALRARAGITGG